MLLGVCNRLGIKFGIDKLLFQVLFVIWFANDPTAFWWYLLLSFIL